MNPGPSGGGTDYDPFDFADGNAMWILCERNLAYGSFGGIIDFAGPNAAGWGPVIVRYNLGINCGFDFTYGGAGIGSFAVQGEGNNGVHQWYGNTFVLCAANSAMPGSYNNGSFSGLGTSQGFFANNIIVTIYPWYAVKFDATPTAWINNNNCWFGAGADFDFRPAGGMAWSTYNLAKMNVPTFDQTGTAGDPLFAQGISSTSWSTGVVTVNTSVPHGQTGTFQVTIDGNNWYNGASPTVLNGTFTATVTGTTSFTYPLAGSDPTAGGFPASTGTWAVGTVPATLVAASWRLGSTSSSCYRTGINVATTYGVDAGSTDLFGNTINPLLSNIGCDANGSP